MGLQTNNPANRERENEMTVGKIKITGKHWADAVQQLGGYSNLAICNKAIEIALAEQATEQYITAEEAQKLGAGKAEWYHRDLGDWAICSEAFNYLVEGNGAMYKYRAIKQEPVEPINHIELLGEIYGFLQSICPEGIADEAFRIVPEAIRTQAIARYAEPSDAIRERVRHTQEVGRTEVEPHAELKAMYEQQVEDGTIMDFVWEYLPNYAQWNWLGLNGETIVPSWNKQYQYRCTPKPTCQVRNDDTGELKTMTRHDVINLLKELGVING